MPQTSERYARQIVLPGVGAGGQARLRDAQVLVIGVGGLGSPAALYLCAAGVGTLGVADGDQVEPSNLARQILYTTADLGAPKTEVARRRLTALNPEIQVHTHPLRVTEANLASVLTGYDFVLDCTDSFEAKFAINDACVRLGIPFCHAGVTQFHGQLMTVLPGRSPCLRCLFAAPPPEGSVPTPAVAGVFGPAAAALGTLQAGEALRFVLGVGELTTGRLLMMDQLRMRWRQVSVPRDPYCPACASDPSLEDPLPDPA